MILFIKHIAIEGPGTLGEFFNNQTTWKTKIVELEKEEALPSLDECEAVISLGGPMNVYETRKYPFLEKEENFFKLALEKQIPILGICLGAQLLAKVCGSKIKKANNKEIGWHKVSLTEDGRQDNLFSSVPSKFDVFQWHEDMFELPKGALLLAESQDCPNQAFRFGKNAYGLQFHIEVTPEMIETWVNIYKEEAKRFNAQEILLESYKTKEVFRRQADIIYFNFARIVSNK